MPRKIIGYINHVAELYSELGSATTESDKQELNKKIKTYIKDSGADFVTYADVEEAFSYLLSTTVDVCANYNKAVDSKLMVIITLLKQNSNISNKTYDSVITQFNAINRDYHVKAKGETNNGKETK